MTGSGVDAIPETRHPQTATLFEIPSRVPVVCGVGVVRQVGPFSSAFGSRVLIVCGEQSAQACGALDQVRDVLQQANASVEVIEGIPPEPGVAVVDAGARMARMWRADVIVAIGGGSVIDAAKAIAAGARQPVSFRAFLSGIRRPDDVIVDAIPVVAIPTLPGAGSETNGTSVITDEASGRKLSSHAAACAPQLALIDPSFAHSVAPDVLGPGLADALCHAVEASLSSQATMASDACAEQAIRMLMRDAEPALAGDIDALARSWLATNLASEALSLSSSLPTHPIAHALGAQLRRRHARAVVAVEYAVIARFGDGWPDDRLERLAEWMGSQTRGEQAALRGVLGRLAKFVKAMRCTDSVVELGLDAEMLDEIVHDVLASGSRGLRSLAGADVTADTVYEVLDLAITCPPSAPVKTLLAQRDAIVGATAS